MSEQVAGSGNRIPLVWAIQGVISTILAGATLASLSGWSIILSSVVALIVVAASLTIGFRVGLSLAHTSLALIPLVIAATTYGSANVSPGSVVLVSLVVVGAVGYSTAALIHSLHQRLRRDSALED